jgi:hypothetical protein
MNKKKMLMAKALSFTNSIRSMTSDDRKELPSEVYANDYNQLRSLVLREFMEIANLLPPGAQTFEAIGHKRLSAQRFSEIDTFCEQIYQLLSALDE